MVILKRAESGVPVAKRCREHDVSSATFCKWQSKSGGMDVAMRSRLKGLEEKHRSLKKMYAEVHLHKDVLQEALRRKW